jgi:hypothetical protein
VHYWQRPDVTPMKQHRRRKCRHCGELFHPDPRNRRHQHYCSKPACRRASKAASQRRWLSKAANRDYFRGAVNVQRVRAWRAAHPGYWKRDRPESSPGLQEDSGARALENKAPAGDLAAPALQDLLSAQPFVLIGLIANLTGTALQEDIAQTGRKLQQLGQDILTGANRAEGGCDAKTPVGPLTGAPGPPAV